MAIRKPEITEPGYYFITFTCYKWKPLLEIVNGFDLVYRWFSYLEESANKIIGYVIMPNHVHLLLAYNDHRKSLNGLVGEGKRFIAYDIVKRLKQMNAHETLSTLQTAVNTTDRRRGKLHEVFAESFEVKRCESRRFLLQKLEYIHNNPCSGKWQLAPFPGDYEHSSASYYETGKPGKFPVWLWLELEADGWWEQAAKP